MQILYDFYRIVLDLSEQGGPVIVAILLLSTLMWILIIERYLFMLFSFPRQLREVERQWQAREDHHSWYARRIREGLTSELANAVHRRLLPLRTLVMVLPLLGLLGTVIGMISTFDVMMIFGNNNARGLAAGISVALTTTTAGLVTALSGLFFSANLQQRARLEINKLTDHLN